MQAQSLKCTFESDTPCPNRAHRAFKWPWGKTGVTCREHMPHLQSLADQLQRPIEFSDAFEPSTTVEVAPEPRKQRFLDVATMADLDTALNLVMGEIREAWHSVEDLESAHARLSDQANALKEKLAAVQKPEAPAKPRKQAPAPQTTVVDGSDTVGLESSDNVDQTEKNGPETPVSGRNRVQGQGVAETDRVVETRRETPK
jgi:hypothetical protein